MLFFFNDTATTAIYTLSLHDALPISAPVDQEPSSIVGVVPYIAPEVLNGKPYTQKSDIYSFGILMYMAFRLILLRSEEHTSELQSRPHLVCRLLLEKKKKKNYHPTTT